MPEENNLEIDENEIMKRGKKTKDDDVLSAVAWAFILIWAGIVFLAANLGWFSALGFNVDTNWAFHSFSDWHNFGVWNLVALGAGGIVLVEFFIRLLVPKFRQHIAGSLIGSAVLIGIGLGGWLNWDYLWPIFLIAVGINALVAGIKSR